MSVLWAYIYLYVLLCPIGEFFTRMKTSSAIIGEVPQSWYVAVSLVFFFLCDMGPPVIRSYLRDMLLSLSLLMLGSW